MPHINSTRMSGKPWEQGRMAREVKPGKQFDAWECRSEPGIVSTTPTFAMKSV